MHPRRVAHLVHNLGAQDDIILSATRCLCEAMDLVPIEDAGRRVNSVGRSAAAMPSRHGRRLSARIRALVCAARAYFVGRDCGVGRRQAVAADGGLDYLYRKRVAIRDANVRRLAHLFGKQRST